MREFPGDQITDFYIARRYIIEVDDPTYLTPGGPPVGGPAAPCVIEVGLHATPQGGTFDVLGDSGDWQYCGYLFVDSLGVIHQRPPPDNILWREPIEWKAGVKTYLTFAGQVDNFEAEPLSPSIGPFQFGITFVIGSPESVDVGNLTNPSDTSPDLAVMSDEAMIPAGGNFLWLLRWNGKYWVESDFFHNIPLIFPQTYILWKRGDGHGRATARLTVENDCDYFGEDPVGPTPVPVQPCGDM